MKCIPLLVEIYNVVGKLVNLLRSRSMFIRKCLFSWRYFQIDSILLLRLLALSTLIVLHIVISVMHAF